MFSGIVARSYTSFGCFVPVPSSRPLLSLVPCMLHSSNQQTLRRWRHTARPKLCCCAGSITTGLQMDGGFDGRGKTYERSRGFEELIIAVGTSRSWISWIMKQNGVQGLLGLNGTRKPMIHVVYGALPCVSDHLWPNLLLAIGRSGTTYNKGCKPPSSLVVLPGPETDSPVDYPHSSAMAKLPLPTVIPMAIQQC